VILVWGWEEDVDSNNEKDIVNNKAIRKMAEILDIPMTLIKEFWIFDLKSFEIIH